MAIPGEAPDPYEVRGKIRIGVKGEKFPKSVDYFVSDDPEIQALGEKPKEILITFPYSTADENFSAGLEWWKGQLLVCYTKDGSDDPVALRVDGMRLGSGDSANVVSFLDPDDVKVSEEKVGQGRSRIKCRANDCPHFEQNAQKKECRPMARLQFFIWGGRTDQVLQFETKSWNTIRGIRKVLTSAERRGPFAGRVFKLSVKFDRKGSSTFPVVSIEEVNVDVNTEQDVTLADALIVLRKAVETKDAPATRSALAGVLDITTANWRERPEVTEKIKAVGVDVAAATVLLRYEA